MSAMKRVIEDIMDLWTSGIPLAEIAKQLQIPVDMVESVVEEYSSFYD